MTARDKIKDLDELAGLLDSLRDSRRIVHCHGVFDLLHIGHIRHFEQARRLGNLLVVTITPDRFVNKGPHRPVFSEQLRAEAVASLEGVDFVAINRWPTAVETIRRLRPHVYAKGSEYKDPAKDLTGKIADEAQAVTEVGGQMAFTEDIVFSSSALLNRYFSVLPEEAADFLATFRQRHSLGQVLGFLEAARPLKALVVGEAIIDEYHYCETMGKAGKEPVLAARYLSTEKFAGGVLAVANQVAEFCGQVGLLTMLGEDDSHEEFIRPRLNPKIEPCFIPLAGQPTIIKRRFVEHYPFQKMFEIYIMGDLFGDEALTRSLGEQLKCLLPDFDLVVAADYGHGFIGPEAIRVLCDQAKFLAVNTQANAGNHGFNTISKYPRADYIAISEREIRLETRKRRRDLRLIVEEVSQKLSCPRILVTRGQQGCLSYHDQEGFVEVPALSNRIVDRVGAGDAVLAVTALCACLAAPMEIIGLIGNAVGAQAVATVANREPVGAVALAKHLESLLK